MKREYRVDYVAIYHRAAFVEAASLEEARALIMCELSARLHPGGHPRPVQRARFTEPALIGGARECAARSAEIGTLEAQRLMQQEIVLEEVQIKTAFREGHSYD